MPADDRASGSRAADSTKMGNGKAAAHDTAAAGRQAAARESAAGSTAARREGGTAAGAGLVVTGAGKVYASRHRGEPPVTALRDVSFTIAPGAAVGLVGASGSGKSTLAKMITGSERPTSGSITFGAVAIERL